MLLSECRTVSLPQKFSLPLVVQLSNYTWCLANTGLFSDSSFIFSKVSYEWNSIVCFLLKQGTCISGVFLVFEIYPSYINSPFLLLLSSIPFYRCTMVCLFSHPLKDIWVVSSIFLNYSPTTNTFLQVSVRNLSFHFYKIKTTE